MISLYKCLRQDLDLACEPVAYSYIVLPVGSDATAENVYWENKRCLLFV